jgi:hypothetical protein
MISGAIIFPAQKCRPSLFDMLTIQPNLLSKGDPFTTRLRSLTEPASTVIEDETRRRTGRRTEAMVDRMRNGIDLFVTGIEGKKRKKEGKKKKEEERG